jgi:hypothetical protein
MNHNEITLLLSGFSDKYLSAEAYSALGNFAQNKHFADLMAEDEKDLIALRPFIISMGTDFDLRPLMVDANGVAIIPVDYEEYDDLRIFNNGVQEKVEVVDQQEFACRLTHTVEVPTKEYPICTFMGTKIKFAPVNVQYVNFSYFRRPNTVNLAVDTTLGYARYDSTNSVEFEWDTHNMVQIILIILQELGVSATQDEVQTKINKGK